MNPEQLAELIRGVGVAVGVPFVTWLWLKRTTKALDQVPLLQRDLEQLTKALEGVTSAMQALEKVPLLQRDLASLTSLVEEVARSAKAAHARLDAYVRDVHDRFDLQMQRIVRMETRWESHDREQDRRDGDVAARLQRVEEKIDALPADVSPRLQRLEDKLDAVADALHGKASKSSGAGA